MSHLSIGDQAPVFRLRDQLGAWVDLAEILARQPVVLIFYPGDDTPGCTKQLCAIRDDWQQFQDAGIAVLGINHADAQSHQRFIDTYRLTIPLLVDADREVAKMYGAVHFAINPLDIHRMVVGISQDGRIRFIKDGMPADEEILASMTHST